MSDEDAPLVRDAIRLQPAAAPVIRLHASDNVVIATEALASDSVIASEGLRTVTPIPSGHKIATRPIGAGEPVIRYGQVIGAATKAIARGAHVHLHNLEVSSRRVAAEPRQNPTSNEPARHFMGYRRTDGRVGVRNYVAILTSVNCSATVARLIADSAERSGLLKDFPNVDGVVPLTHNSGCGMAGDGEGFDVLQRTLWGSATNPNFGAILLIGLGCEVMQTARLASTYRLEARPDFDTFTIQETGGTRKAVEAGLARLTDLLSHANAARRAQTQASELVIGLQCGGSDAWSGITSNPALGNAADRLVALGGTVILSETPEIYGAEHLLYARAASPEISAKLRARMEWWERHTKLHGVEMNNNPSPGNKAGGLTTILEKSLGAVAKSGTSPMRDVIEYAQPLRTRGFVFMDSPGFDPCSATGQVASGANMIAFTTGRGSAFGCKPSPSIKLSSNTDIYRHMQDDIDIDCGGIATGHATVEEKGAEILSCILDVASGDRSKSELLGYGGAEFVPWLLGPTM